MSALATQPAVEMPWSDEVDGVPTNNAVHHDDGDAIHVTETRSHQLDAEKRSLARTNTTTTVEDGVTERRDRTHTVGVAGGGGSYGQASSTEHTIGSGDGAVTTKTGHARTFNAGKSGAGMTFAKDTEVKVGDHVHGDSVERGLAWNNGLEAQHKRTIKKTDGTHSSEDESGWAWKDGKVGYSLGQKRAVKDGPSSGQNVDLAVGPGGVAGSVARSATSAKGTRRSATGGFSFDDEGNVAASAGASVKTKSGLSANVAVKAGITVKTSEPKAVGDRWEVTYTRTNSVGANAGGGAKAVSVTAGVSREAYDVGTRSFKTKAEAEDFVKHAGERITAEAVDPRTLEGAMSMQVGESMGHGEATSGALGAEVTFKGFGAGASASHKESEEVSVRRVSANLFDVTARTAETTGKDVNLKAPVATLNHGDSSSLGHAVTVRFDLASPDGQAAFQSFCATRKIPGKGGRILSDAESKGHEVHDGVSLMGVFDETIKSRTWQNRTYDEQGKHEEFGGEKTRDKTPGWLGRKLFDEKERHESVSLVGKQEDDRTADYELNASFSGADAAATRRGLALLAGDDDDRFSGDLKASGTWKMSADVPLASIKKAIKNDPRFRGLTGNDAQMIALTEMIARDGKQGVRELEHNAEHRLAWDLELDGDANFPGKAGRAALEDKAEKYAELMRLSIASPGQLVGQLQVEIDALKLRRKEIADPRRYPDLPGELRRQQLELVDYHIMQFQTVRHQGAVELSRRDPDEDLMMMTPEQRELAHVRDEIADCDEILGSLEAQSRETRAAVATAIGHYTDEERAETAGPAARQDRVDLLELGELGADQHQRQTLKLDDLRMEFLQSLSDPVEAAMLGKMLATSLRGQIAAAGEALERLNQAARLQAVMNGDRATSAGRHAAFWTDLEDTMPSAQFAVREEAPVPVSMRL